MFPKFKILNPKLIFSIFLFLSFVNADDIPTLLWNIKGNSLQMKPVSAFGSGNPILSESLEDVLKQKAHVLVFAINKLSLEDFSNKEIQGGLDNSLYNLETFLDEQEYMFLPSVKDPLNIIHNTHCGVQEIVVDDKIDENILKSVSAAIERSCVVVLHIADDGIVSKKDEINKVFAPIFENSDRNLVGAFTGVKSSWGSQNEEHHIFRNLLATESADENNFVNFTNCLIMYAENSTIHLKESNTTVDLSSRPNTDGSFCGNDSVLQLKFETSGDLTSVTLKFLFERKGSSWCTPNATVTMSGEKAVSGETQLKSRLIEAPLGFSYSCGDFRLSSEKGDIVIAMNRFQIQPYEVKSAFSDSFDCVPWFTIPIWMGVFVSLLFIIILNFGVYALFAVNTMDRFDDPKGKTISVNTVGE